MRKPNKSIPLLIILSLVFLCANQNAAAAQRKSNTKPAKSTSAISTKSSSVGDKDTDQTEMDKMVMAIQAGDIAKVKNAITATADLVKKKDRNGYTLLYYAVKGNQKSIVELLLHKGSNIKDKVWDVPILFIAISFISNSNDLNDMIKLLIANGADVKQTDKSKGSILHKMMSTNTVSLLIANGADVNAKDAGGVTPLHCIAGGKGPEGINNIDVAKMLLVSGADINVKDNQRGYSPLHWATEGNYKDMVIFLIEQGADLNAKDKKGRTPYSLAIEKRNSEMVKLLEGKGAK